MGLLFQTLGAAAGRFSDIRQDERETKKEYGRRKRPAASARGAGRERWRRGRTPSGKCGLTN